MTFKEIMALPWKEGSNQTTGEYVLKWLNGCYQQGEAGYLTPIGCMMIVFEVPDHEITMDELVKCVNIEHSQFVYVTNPSDKYRPNNFDELNKLFIKTSKHISQQQ